MTKEKYLEMCEMLGAEPSEEEMPVEFEDLILDVQEVLPVYSVLQDSWDTMSGTYLGKNLSNIKYILEIYEIENSRAALQIISIIDSIRAKQLNKKRAKGEPAN